MYQGLRLEAFEEAQTGGGMRGFPLSFLNGFLSTQKVSCFLCAESHREIRKLSRKTRVNIEATGFPRQETLSTPGNCGFPLGFLEGFI